MNSNIKEHLILEENKIGLEELLISNFFSFSLDAHIPTKSRRTIEEIDEIETPEKDESYTPLGHGRAFRLVKQALVDTGSHILREYHAVARKGQRYMGLMPIVPQEPEMLYNTYFPVVGVRNSHDKQFAFELLIAAGVQGVGNLLFTRKKAIGMRRHVNINDTRLYDSIYKSLSNLNNSLEKQEKRLKYYRGEEIESLVEVHHIIFELHKEGHVPKSLMPGVERAWRKPPHPLIEHFGNSIWKLLNCVLYARREKDVFLQPERNAKLASFFDGLAGGAADCA